MDIIQEVKKLNLPLSELVVVSGGTLQVLGIRNTNDIDLAATENLYNHLLKDVNWIQDIRKDGIWLKKGVVEVLPKLEWKNYPITAQEAIDNAIVVEGVNFMNLNHLIKFKKALGRDKDFNDINLINEYLEKTTSM